MKKRKLLTYLLIGSMIMLSGCQNHKNDYTSGMVSTVTTKNVKQLSIASNIYTSSDLNNTDTILLGGEKGLFVTSLSGDKSLSRSIGSTFRIPSFSTSNESNSTSITRTATTDTNSSSVKIYTICNTSNALFIGGYFSQVNGVEKNNIVKLSMSGMIDNNFIGDVEGTVYKIINLPDNNLLVAGAFGAFNEKVVHSITKINANGLVDESFKPFNDYMLAKINDIALLPNNEILVAGTFIKDANESDQNSTMEEMVQKTETLIVLDQNGAIDKEYTEKFSDIKHEVYAVNIYGNKIYIGGNFEFIYNDKYYNNVVAYSLDGVFDGSFHIGKSSGVVFDVKADATKVIYAGDFIMDDNLQTRSFYIADLTGKTIKIDNFEVDSDIYSIEVYNGNLVLTGDGNYSLNGQDYANNINLQLDN